MKQIIITHLVEWSAMSSTVELAYSSYVGMTHGRAMMEVTPGRVMA